MEKVLSSGGKEVLIKSVAQSILVYSMACFKLPRGLCQHINGILRKFWWGSKKGERKTSWVSWDVMTQPKFMGGMGFRDIELFNLALLARQAWRLLQEPNSLSARILKAVYYPSVSILDAELGKNPSQVWRSLVEGRDTLKLGLIKRIGSGAETNIWTDHWIPRDFKLRPVCPKTLNPPQLVSDLINPVTFAWDIETLDEHLYPMDKEAILNIPLSSRVRQDFWSWHYERRGVFTVRSAYKLLSATKQQRTDWLEHNDGHSQIEADRGSWAKLWGAAVPAKVRVFAWRLAKCSIPTGEVRQHRSMAVSAECSLCHAAVDTWRHSLFDCHMARCVWALADEDLTDTIISNRTEDPKLWLLWLEDTLNTDDLARALVTMWAIWWARRRAIHDDQFQSPLSTHIFVNKYLVELEMLPKKCTQQKARAANPRDLHVNARDLHVNTGLQVEPAAGIGWLPPESHDFKINVDGGFSKIGDRAASAAVCRDKGGKYIGASAIIYEGRLNPTILEAEACSEALSLAADLHLRSVCVATDCLEVVTNLREEAPCGYYPILQDIKYQSRLFSDLSFIHENRKYNGEAHALAKAAASLSPGRHVWLSIVPEIICIPMFLNV